MAGAFSGFKEAISHRRATNNAQDTVKNINKIVEKLPDVAGGGKFVDGLKEHSEKLSRYHNAYKDAVLSGEGVKSSRDSLREVQKQAFAAFKEAKKHVGDAKAFARGKFVGRVVSSKPVKILAGAGAVVGAVSWLTSRRAKQNREEVVEARNQQINDMRADVAAMKGANTMMGLEPVAGDHAARVAAGRNGASAGVNTSNPEVSLPYDIVRT